MAGTDFTVFIINDDATVSGSLAELLHSAGYCARTYSCPNTFLNEHDWALPGCVLLDLRMKDLDGLQVQQRLMGHPLERPVIFLASRSNINSCVQAMKAGAIDFLRKPVDREKLFDAVNRAKERDTRMRRSAMDREVIAKRERRLSPREREVLRHVIAGLQNPQIARALGISLKTVKVHRGHVMYKMQATSVAELVRMTERISLQPVELSNWLAQTVKREKKLAKRVRQNKRRRQIVAQPANSNLDFVEPTAALLKGNGYGPIVGLPSIRSTVS